MRTEEIHALYRFFGRDDELLYIGITFDLPARLAAHRKGKHWWSDIVRIGIESHTSRKAALEAERQAIIAEQPRWNVTHNQRPVALERDPALPGGRIRWVCGSCEAEIWHGGALWVNLDRFAEVRRAQLVEDNRRIGQPASFGDVLLESLIHAPRLLRWHVSCEVCFVGVEASYDISLEQCRSLAALIKWTAHLHGKSWFLATDWIHFIHEIAQLTGSPLEPVGVV